MKVISYDPFAPDATHSLDDLLAEADVVSMHAAVTPETARDHRRRAVRRMKEGAIYINTARAGLHDTDALIAVARRRATSAAPASTTSSASTSTSTTRSARWERRAHAAHRRRDLRHRGRTTRRSSSTGS